MNPPTASPIRPVVSRSVNVSRARVNFAVFAVVTAGFGWLYVALDKATGAPIGTGSASDAGGTSGQGLWIVVPAITAVALYLGSRDGTGTLGLAPRFRHPIRWLGLAAGLSLAITVLILTTGIAAGAVTFHLTPASGKQALPSAVAAVLGFMLVKNVLEEFIFRGYATRTAQGLGLPGVWPHLLVGAVWAAWHLPLYLVWMSHAQYAAGTSLPKGVYLPMFCLGTLALAVVLGELRVQSGSIWPGVLLHTLSGALAAPLLSDGHLTFYSHSDALFSPNANSIASMLTFALAGLVLHRRASTATTHDMPRNLA